MNLRKEAKGRACQVRIPSVCNFNSETTVLAHLGIPGTQGRGIKAIDLCGTWACSACHNEIDNRTHNYSMYDKEVTTQGVIRILLRNWAYDGMLRTLTILHKEGKV